MGVDKINPIKFESNMRERTNSSGSGLGYGKFHIQPIVIPHHASEIPPCSKIFLATAAFNDYKRTTLAPECVI